ncbi:MAG: hypothetical protein WCS85_00170 [Candidatus Peribacteraceae bacterium]
MNTTAFAPGKIILCGEYAVVFGSPGIAVPAPIGMKVMMEENAAMRGVKIQWHGIEGTEEWNRYARSAIELLHEGKKPFRGTVTITNELPLGKGMGSSTALVCALTRCLLGPGKREEALRVEDAMNPGHSGLDFSVIWSAKPVLFQKGKEPQAIDVQNMLQDAVFIDTGMPTETTPQLVAWVKERSENPAIKRALDIIGGCAPRLLNGEDLEDIFRDHHRAQITLGVVPPATQKLIADIERAGGSAKVIGAGGKTGGGGIVLSLGISEHTVRKLPGAKGFLLLHLS